MSNLRENDNVGKARKINDYEDILNSGKLPSNKLNLNLKALSNPTFLGSYHLKETSDPRFNTYSKLMKGDLEVKYSKALRNTIANPITIGLIISAIIFNIIWFFVL